MSASLASRLGPEAVLEAVFAQAFAGGACKLPAGFTKADLRAALALKPAVQTSIYERSRLHFRSQGSLAARPANSTAGRWVGLAVAVATVTSICLAGILSQCGLLKVYTSTIEAVVKSVLPVALPQPLRQTPALPAPKPVAQLLAQAIRDPSALAALQRRAATGDASAADALASLLDSQRTQDEITVPKDDKAAFALYEQAARAGNTDAEFAVGQAYQRGFGIAPDATLATAWYRAAALNGLASAQTSLGFAYQTGLGIARDDSAAALWFARAAAQSDPSGETALGYLELYGRGVVRDRAQAIALFSQAATRNFGPAFLALGYCYAQGLGTTQNLALASQYFLKANQSGVAQAKSALAMLGSSETEANFPLTP